MPNQDIGTQILIRSRERPLASTSQGDPIQWLRTDSMQSGIKNGSILAIVGGAAILFVPKVFVWPLIIVSVSVGLVAATK